MRIDFKTDFTALDKALREIREDLQGKDENHVAKALMKAAYPVWREAQARAPISKKDVGAFTKVGFGREGVKIYGPDKHQPGLLRRSIKRLKHPNPQKWSELVGIGVFLPKRGTRDDTAYYAPFVEFGTVRQKAQPFLRPAIENNKGTVVDIFGRDLGQRIERVGKKVGKKYLNYGDRRTKV